MGWFVAFLVSAPVLCMISAVYFNLVVGWFAFLVSSAPFISSGFKPLGGLPQVFTPEIQGGPRRCSYYYLVRPSNFPIDQFFEVSPIQVYFKGQWMWSGWLICADRIWLLALTLGRYER